MKQSPTVQGEYVTVDLSLAAAHCRGGYYFFLDKKVAKNQDNKDASTLPAGSSRFFRCSSASHFHIT
jgi:hypothetical protein